MSQMIELRACFFGNVQGVGLRSYVKIVAAELRLKGYVKNMASGSVELCAVGEKQLLEELLKKILNRYKTNIEQLEKSFCKSVRDFSTFEIRY